MPLIKTRPAPTWLTKELFSLPLWRLFRISTTPRRLMAGGVFTLLMVCLVALRTAAFLQAGLAQGALLYALCYGACLVLGILTCLHWQILKPRVSTILNVSVTVLLPIVAMTMV